MPNVMADGAPIVSTVLSLSHWPASPTPAALAHDLSAGTALRYVRSRRSWPEAMAVTADHFDADGLVTLSVLTDPEWACTHAPELLAVAEAGDFVRTASRDAARVAFAVDALAAGWALGAERNPALGGGLHRAGLDRLPRLLADPGAFRADWAEEDAALTAAEAALESGVVLLDEVADLDLVVVTMARAGAPWHRMAVHNRTDRMRVLVLAPPHYQLYLRYETWVRLARRPRLPLRPDLTPLAGELTAAEPSGTTWRFDGAAAIRPRLSPESDVPSDLAPDAVRSLVEAALARARPGWDPYAPR